MPAAASPVTGHSETLIAPVLDSGVAHTFLEPASRRRPPDGHAARVRDGAGDRPAMAVRCPATVTLIQLPRYGPELNPVESPWHYLWSHHRSNRRYQDVEALRGAAEDARRGCRLDEAAIRSECGAPEVTIAIIT